MRSSCQAREGRVLLDSESEACSRADFLHADFLRLDFLEPDALKAGAFKRPETGAQKYRHDINMKLVDESRIQELLSYADAADHLNCLIAGGSFCSGDC